MNIFQYTEEELMNNMKSILENVPTRLVNTFFREVITKYPQAIIKNMDVILSEDDIDYDIQNFFGMKGIDARVDKAINERFKTSTTNLMGRLLARECVFWSDDIPEKEQQRFFYMLDKVVRELLAEQGKDYTDIGYVNSGDYSTVFQIGNRILKIGEELKKYQIPNHRRILQPIARTNYTLEDGTVLGYMEVTSLVNTNFSPEEKDNEKLYQVYKELRDDGIIWLDAKWNNVGKMLGDNITRWRGKLTNIPPCSVGFDKEFKGKPLAKGEIAVIDLDYLYRIDDPNLRLDCATYLSERFEERYTRELMTAKGIDDIEDR